MAALASGIFSHAMTAGQALSGSSATPLASPATGTDDTGSTSSTDSSTISANDFLTLLVTEMQNQDPTADTDPNEYINQLVNVNSLEQLIDINQNLSTALGTSSSSAQSTTAITQAGLPASAASSPAASSPAASTSAALSASSAGPAGGLSALSAALKRAPGNLAVPDALPAAKTVAHALDGRAHAQSAANRLPAAR